MARYLNWTDEDQYYHLCASLEGAAGQVLWDAGLQATTGSIIRLLQTMFGSELQAERFKAELRARCRDSGEPLQRLYQEICRLVAMAYPSAEPSLTTHVAKEAFVTALNNFKLQIEVTKKEPQNIQEALNYAIKLEAFEQSLLVHGDNSDSADNDDVRTKRR